MTQIEMEQAQAIIRYCRASVPSKTERVKAMAKDILCAIISSDADYQYGKDYAERVDTAFELAKMIESHEV